MASPISLSLRPARGPSGWSPVLSAVSDGDRRVLRVANWVGGQGTKPAVGSYVGSSGFVSTAAEAVDVRAGSGGAGVSSVFGEDGDVASVPYLVIRSLPDGDLVKMELVINAAGDPKPRYTVL